MRVVLLNQYYAPDEAATSQILTDLGRGLAAAGHDVTAVCCRRSYANPAVRYPARETLDGVRILRARSTGFGRGSRVGRVLDYATFLVGAGWTLIARCRPDVVVSLSTPPFVAVLGWAAARIRGARSIYWVMDVYPDLAFELGVLREGSIAGRVLERLSRFTLRRSDRVVALGEAMRERLRSKGRDDVVSIHNWADGGAILPIDPSASALRREWGWDDRFVVLYSGNMGLAHEFETALDAAALLADEPRVLFAFLGGGPRRGEIERGVRDRGLANVELRPYVARERLGESLTAGDLHLVSLRPSLAGLLVPSKIYGILAAGRPTLYVGPPRGEIADIIGAGSCGTRVEPGDARGLADAVRGYLHDDERVALDGRRARSLFEERFSKERGLREFAALLEARGSGGGDERWR